MKQLTAFTLAVFLSFIAAGSPLVNPFILSVCLFVVSLFGLLVACVWLMRSVNTARQLKNRISADR
jgi:hypothetical protein